MSRALWIPQSGYPFDPFNLTEAMRAIPNCRLNAEGLATMEKRLQKAEMVGWEADQPSARSASQAANERAVFHLHALLKRLLTHMESLPLEACEALQKEGFNVRGYLPEVDMLCDASRDAFRQLSVSDDPKGRPVENRSRLLADEAAVIFEEISGSPPTYTTDVTRNASPRRVGPWPEFLARVFAAYFVKASTDAHVERIAKSRKAKVTRA